MRKWGIKVISLANKRKEEIETILSDIYNLILKDKTNNSHEDCLISNNILYFTRNEITKFPNRDKVYGFLDYGFRAGYIKKYKKIKNKYWYNFNIK